jgi:hypothetical protein
VLVLAAPARSALSLALRYRRPASVDLAAAWIEGNIKSHALVATGLPRFVLARDRFEVRSWAPLRDCPPRVLRHYDLLVAARAELLELPVRLLGDFDDGSGSLVVAAPERPPLEPIVPAKAAASHDADHAAGPWSRRSAWRSPEGSAWISAEWAAPEAIERVELVSDQAGGLKPQSLEIEGRMGPEAAWRKLAVWPLRPGRLSRQSLDGPPGQIYVMVPAVSLTGLRISSQGGGEWGLARIDVLAAVDAAPLSSADRAGR